MAGKTGTTQQHKSAAFIGIIPQMSGAVIAFDNSNAPRPLCDGAGAPFPCREGNIFGGKTPAETWFGAMKPLLEGQPVQPLPPTDPRYTEGGAESKVPDVRGRGLNDARGILERAGWKVTTRPEPNRATRGTVVGQDPLAPRCRARPILLNVSTGEVPPPPAPPGDGGDDGDDGGDDDGGDDGRGRRRLTAVCPDSHVQGVRCPELAFGRRRPTGRLTTGRRAEPRSCRAPRLP